MFYDDHPPPHFHAVYAGYNAQVVIATGEILRGSLPSRAQRLVREWAELHRRELDEDWQLGAQKQPLMPIEPLE